MSKGPWPTPAYQQRIALKAKRRAERERRAVVRQPSRIVRGFNFAAQLLAGWRAAVRAR